MKMECRFLDFLERPALGADYRFVLKRWSAGT